MKEFVLGALVVLLSLPFSETHNTIENNNGGQTASSSILTAAKDNVNNVLDNLQVHEQQINDDVRKIDLLQDRLRPEEHIKGRESELFKLHREYWNALKHRWRHRRIRIGQNGNGNLHDGLTIIVHLNRPADATRSASQKNSKNYSHIKETKRNIDFESGVNNFKSTATMATTTVDTQKRRIPDSLKPSDVDSDIAISLKGDKTNSSFPDYLHLSLPGDFETSEAEDAKMLFDLLNTKLEINSSGWPKKQRKVGMITQATVIQSTQSEVVKKALKIDEKVLNDATNAEKLFSLSSFSPMLSSSSSTSTTSIPASVYTTKLPLVQSSVPIAPPSVIPPPIGIPPVPLNPVETHVVIAGSAKVLKAGAKALSLKAPIVPPSGISSATRIPPVFPNHLAKALDRPESGKSVETDTQALSPKMSMSSSEILPPIQIPPLSQNPLKRDGLVAESAKTREIHVKSSPKVSLTPPSVIPELPSNPLEIDYKFVDMTNAFLESGKAPSPVPSLYLEENATAKPDADSLQQKITSVPSPVSQPLSVIFPSLLLNPVDAVSEVAENARATGSQDTMVGSKISSLTFPSEINLAGEQEHVEKVSELPIQLSSTTDVIDLQILPPNPSEVAGATVTTEEESQTVVSNISEPTSREAGIKVTEVIVDTSTKKSSPPVVSSLPTTSKASYMSASSSAKSAITVSPVTVSTISFDIHTNISEASIFESEADELSTKSPFVISSIPPTGPPISLNDWDYIIDSEVSSTPPEFEYEELSSKSPFVLSSMPTVLSKEESQKVVPNISEPTSNRAGIKVTEVIVHTGTKESSPPVLPSLRTTSKASYTSVSPSANSTVTVSPVTVSTIPLEVYANISEASIFESEAEELSSKSTKEESQTVVSNISEPPSREGGIEVTEVIVDTSTKKSSPPVVSSLPTTSKASYTSASPLSNSTVTVSPVTVSTISFEVHANISEASIFESEAEDLSSKSTKEESQIVVSNILEPPSREAGIKVTEVIVDTSTKKSSPPVVSSLPTTSKASYTSTSSSANSTITVSPVTVSTILFEVHANIGEANTFESEAEDLSLKSPFVLSSMPTVSTKEESQIEVSNTSYSSEAGIEITEVIGHTSTKESSPPFVSSQPKTSKASYTSASPLSNSTVTVSPVTVSTISFEVHANISEASIFESEADELSTKSPFVISSIPPMGPPISPSDWDYIIDSEVSSTPPEVASLKQKFSDAGSNMSGVSEIEEIKPKLTRSTFFEDTEISEEQPSEKDIAMESFDLASDWNRDMLGKSPIASAASSMVDLSLEGKYKTWLYKIFNVVRN